MLWFILALYRCERTRHKCSNHISINTNKSCYVPPNAFICFFSNTTTDLKTPLHESFCQTNAKVRVHCAKATQPINDMVAVLETPSSATSIRTSHAICKFGSWPWQGGINATTSPVILQLNLINFLLCVLMNVDLRHDKWCEIQCKSRTTSDIKGIHYQQDFTTRKGHTAADVPDKFLSRQTLKRSKFWGLGEC